jgi:hypothetical protein
MTSPFRQLSSPRLICCLVATSMIFAALASVPAFGDPPLPGAVFTTNSGCTGVDLNIYAAKMTCTCNADRTRAERTRLLAATTSKSPIPTVVPC